MIFNKGEVRKVGIEVISQVNDSFAIDAADFTIHMDDGTEIETGSATIDGHKILALFSANEIGKYVCEFSYHIGPEILKAKINVEVI